MPPQPKITYYLDIMSSWCTYVEPVWDTLKERYTGQVDFEWKIALMNREDFPTSQNQCNWFYRRSHGIVPHSPTLNSDWFESGRQGDYEAPHQVAEAGRDFGITDDRLRRTLAVAALQQGHKVGDMKTSVNIAAEAHSLDPDKLHLAAQSDEVRQRIIDSTSQFHAHQLTQRPAFVITSPIGDKAVFAGLVDIKPLAATLDTMLADNRGFQAFADEFGDIPST